MKTKYRIQKAGTGTFWIQRYDSQFLNFSANFWYNIGNSPTLSTAKEYLEKYKNDKNMVTVHED